VKSRAIAGTAQDPLLAALFMEPVKRLAAEFFWSMALENWPHSTLWAILLLWAEVWCREADITSLNPLNMAFPSSLATIREISATSSELFQSHDAVRVVGPAELPLVWMDLLFQRKQSGGRLGGGRRKL